MEAIVIALKKLPWGGRSAIALRSCLQAKAE